LRVLGVEIDPARVEAALPHADPPAIDFRLGGFNLSEICGVESIRLIRCYNVLRQYEESAVEPALQEMAKALEPGGLLIEGTANPSGRLVVFDVYRKVDQDLRHETLVFGTNFRAALDPADFQANLPKRLIHHMRDPLPADFFTAWRDSWQLARGMGRSGLGQWIGAAELLRSRYGYPIDPRLRLIRRGFLTLHHDLASPAHAVGSNLS